MSYDRDAAQRLLGKTHDAATRTYADTSCMLAAAMLQLRCHERGIEGHDDIIAFVRRELLTVIGDTYAAISELIGSVDDYTQDKPVKAVMSKMLTLPYRDRLSKLFADYAKAFKKSNMAKAIMAELPDMISLNIDTSIRLTVAFLRACDDALHRNMLANDRSDLLGQLTTGIKEAGNMTETESDTLFDFACTELDAVAVKECGVYDTEILNGKTRDNALLAANKALRDTTTKLLTDIEKRRTDK